MDVRFLTFDKNILQSNTVGNVCKILTDCYISGNRDRMIDNIKYILLLRKDAMANKVLGPIKNSKKTTVNSKIRQLSRRMNE